VKPVVDSQKRVADLEDVHRAFDIDNSGFIEAKELMLLGQARRKLGQKEGEWTEEMNQRMLDRMDSHGNGKVDRQEFAKYFERILPENAAEFVKTIQEFKSVAAECAKMPPKRTQPSPRSKTPLQRVSVPSRFESHMPSPEKRNQQKSAADQRIIDLELVHKEMDIDRSGFIEAHELMLLGQARRKLEQKQGEWTEEMNERMVTRMDTSGDGKVGAKEFAKYFDRTLPAAPSEFDRTMKEFLAVAAHCQKNPPKRGVRVPQSPTARAVNRVEKRTEPSPRNNTARESAPSVPAVMDSKRRLAELQTVHRAFDIDRSGFIEANELMLMGDARRRLGQKEGEWTEDMNKRMLARMDATGKGKVDAIAFATYFEKVLPADATEFTNTIKEFLSVAASCGNSAPPKRSPASSLRADSNELSTPRGGAKKFQTRSGKPLPLAAKKSKQEQEDMEAIRAAKVARQNASKPTKSKNFDATAYDSMGSKEWDKKLKQAEDSAAAAKASTDARKKRDQEPVPAHAKMDKYLDKY